MKLFTKFKAGAVMASLLAGSQMAMAQSAFSNVSGNGVTAGKVSKNIAQSLVDGASMFEAFLYIAGIVFVCLFIFSLVKWKKSDGREGSPGLIAIYLVAGVMCVAAPTLLGSGITTLFGSGTVQTVKAPTLLN